MNNALEPRLGPSAGSGETRPSRIPMPGLIPFAAAIGVGALWLALSVVTGLIFHFMPAAPMLVAVWVRRALGRDEPIPWRQLRIDLVFGVIVAVATGLAVAAAGGSLDDGWFVAVVIAVGVALATWLGRRRTD